MNICYIDDSSSKVGKEIFWFDQGLEIIRNYDLIENTICLKNYSRKLILKFDNEFSREDWFKTIQNNYSNYKRINENILNSFASQKSMCYAKYFVDCKEYFDHLYEKLMKAEESIWIAGWMISPEICLKRPFSIKEITTGISSKGEYVRLMDVLKHKAEQGVLIKILVYKELSLALTNNSYHVKETFNNLHGNIKVTRHPKSTLDYWSHHEKFVIIDQDAAYVGGLDLCWGRYDSFTHELEEKRNEKEIYKWPGIDYANNRISDFVYVENYLEENVNRNLIPRMPWHDVMVFIRGAAVGDLVRHFVERWNFARLTSDADKQYDIGKIKHHNTIDTNVRNDNVSETDSEFAVIPEAKMKSEEEDYVSEIDAKKEQEISYDLDNVKNMNRSFDFMTTSKYKGKRSDVEDITLKKTISNGDNIHLPDNKRNTPLDVQAPLKFNLNITRKSIIETKKIKAYQDKHRTSGAIPSSSMYEKDRKHRNAVMSKSSKELKKQKEKANVGFFNKIKQIPNGITSVYNKFIDKFKKHPEVSDDYLEMNISKPSAFKNEFKIQVLRSASEWSVGLEKTETSILNAYYHLIENSKHYILIENQFFISKTFTEDELTSTPTVSRSRVVNEIGLRIRQRVERAFKNKEKFKVFIFIPLLPAFAGEIYETTTLQIILKYTYRTICNNHGLSLLEKLEEVLGDSLDEYISFFSLRTHGVVNNEPVTELIYIHSKIMIVDDEIALVGSANINDRSMIGERDSELAVIINDDTKIDSLMNGEPYIASSFAKNLRLRLFKEHLGLFEDPDADKILSDPLDDNFYSLMKSTAKVNTAYYRDTFMVYPDDTYLTYSDVIKAQEEMEKIDLESLKEKYNLIKEFIRGNIVEFPLRFLKDENLNMALFCRERLVALKSFL